MALAKLSKIWYDRLEDRQKQPQCIYDLAFSPDGTRLIAAAGNVVLVYNTADGEIVDMLKGHRDTVYCLSYESSDHLAPYGNKKGLIDKDSTCKSLEKHRQEADRMRVNFAFSGRYVAKHHVKKNY